MTPRTSRSLTLLAAFAALTASSAALSLAPVVARSTEPTSSVPPTAEPTTPPTRAPKRLPDLDPEHYVRHYQGAEHDQTVAVTVAAGRPVYEMSSGAPSPMPSPIGPFDDNRFVDRGDSRWVKVASDAESTFGLDIDTASYRVCQAFLARGRVPEHDSIRAEEWINAFPSPVVVPGAGNDLAVAVSGIAAPHATEGTQLLRLIVGTRQVGERRPPANVTFVVDTSGSMDIADRLGLVKASLALLVQQLDDTDTISIVEYGSTARVVLEPTALTDPNRIVAALESLHADGSTNMQDGLALGYDVSHRSARPGAVNVVVLASDGVANTGVTDADQLTQMLKRASADDVSLVTVGFGMGNYNDDLMEQLADRGDGFFRYIDTFAEAYQLFVNELTPTLTIVARDAKIQVRFNPAAVSEYRLIGYEDRQLDDSKIDDPTVDAGRLGAGHQAVALYEIRRTAAPNGALGSVLLRWKSADGTAKELTAPLAAEAAPSDGTVELAATVALTAEVVRGNAAVVERGVTLAMLEADAKALAERRVPGAADLLKTIQLLRTAQPSPSDSTTSASAPVSGG